MFLRYIMYLNQTGYSLAAQEYVLSILKASNVEIKCDIMAKNHLGIDSDRLSFFNKLSSLKSEKEAIVIYHTVPAFYGAKNINVVSEKQKIKKTIGICLFETMNPNQLWINNMKKVDHIIAASEFNKRIFMSNGYDKDIEVIPHAFDSNMFNAEVKPNGRYSLFTFLSIGTWRQRKNWENLIKAFYFAFSKKNKVCLYIKTDKPKEAKNLIRSIKTNSEFRNKDTAPVFVDEQQVCNLSEIPKIMKKADICICPSLGEGFGYFGLHAMALNIPLITTRYGGCLEYAKEGMVTYIEPKKYKTYPTMDKIPQFQNCIWPIVSYTDIAESMLIAMKSNIQDKSKKAYSFVHDNFNQTVIGNKFINYLNKINENTN